MIYQFLRSRLESVDGLKNKVFPTGVCIDDIEGAFVVYTHKKRTPVRDLSGNVHHYVEEIALDFLGCIYDELHELYYAAELALEKDNLDTGNGEYIFFTECISPQPDSLDPDTGLLRRTMNITIGWCPV